jgi:hypothetical protein
MLRETTKYLLIHADKMGLEHIINKQPSWCSSYLSDHKNIFSIRVPGSSTHKYIKLASGDNPEFIRGTSTDFLALDECALLSSEIVDIATPCLRGCGPDYTYQTLFTTTPRDTSNWLYKRYIAKDIPSTIHIKAPATENFVEFTEEKLEYFKSIMTELMYKREILCEWLDQSSNSMFYAFAPAHHVSTDYVKNRLFISCDINNVNLQTICGFIERDECFIDAEINIKENGSPDKVAYEFHKLYSSSATRQVTVTGDRYGSNKSTTSPSTYYEQLGEELKRLGWHMINRTLISNPSVYDSTMLVNKKFENNKIKINPRCSEFIRHLKEVKWKHNEYVMNKKLLDSGFCDAFRYLIWDSFKPGGKIKATNIF